MHWLPRCGTPSENEVSPSVNGESAGARGALERIAAVHGLDPGQAEALARYADLILGWGKGNVTGLTDPATVVDKLIGDSLALLDVQELRDSEGAVWLDLGAGAGVPGIPLAVARPDARVTLLDAAAKRCAFLEEAVLVAGLHERAEVVCARSERHASAGAPGREAYAVVLARAVSELAVLVELAAPLLRPRGLLLASKTGRALEKEGAAADVAASRCGLVPEAPVVLPASPLDDAVCAVYRKVAPTPDWLPRREGMAAKRPLGG
jgi:16S rRNA (guanine527-N7)-methyltransferase